MFYGASAGVTTVADAGTWTVGSAATGVVSASAMPVCLICVSTKDVFKVEVMDRGATGFTTIADVASETGDTQMDWMFYNTGKDAVIKTTGTGFMRVQGNLVKM